MNAWPMLARCWERQWAGLSFEEQVHVSSAWITGEWPMIRMDHTMQMDCRPIWMMVYGPCAMILMGMKEG